MSSLKINKPIDSNKKELDDKLKLIAFYLTQYHPIKENDEWWGKGFTEWTNVTKSKPLFDGHYQPHLPTDLGFYDLRVRETRREQIHLAKEYGIDAFCYHYYWFSGTRLLNTPLDDMLSDTKSNMPFCLCWANENWTRRWDAAEHEILISQKYLPDDDINFIKSLVPYFSDSRYLKFNGSPFFIVYRPQHLPNAKETVKLWRDYCKTQGFEHIHISAALTHGNTDYTQFGFDSGVEFPPHNLNCETVNSDVNFYTKFKGTILQYEAIAKSYLNREYKGEKIFKTVFPSWDNTARTKNRSLIVLNGTPDNYEHWLTKTIGKSKENAVNNENFVFINAWNEWAEGCHLEPDRRFQRAFLEATKKAKENASQIRGFSHLEPLTSIKEQKQSLAKDIIEVVGNHLSLFLVRLADWIKKYPKVRKIIRKILLR